MTGVAVFRLLSVVLMFLLLQEARAENASNPLAAVTSTDLRWQYLEAESGDVRLNDLFVDGAFMASPKLKIKYELHYWETNVTGRSEKGWESALIKAIYFPTEGMTDSGTGYRVAVGLDYIHDLGDTDKGIGTGANQVGPFAGVALKLKGGLSVIPLLQHFEGVGGSDFSLTSARLIAIQSLEKGRWLKLDIKLPYDWDSSAIPAEGEIQFGGFLTESVGMYVDAKVGIGADRLYNWGIGIGVRFRY